MIKLGQKHQKIIAIFLEKGAMQSSAVHLEIIKQYDFAAQNYAVK